MNKWYIRRPDLLATMICDSFGEAMQRWFEGYNPPFRVIAGERVFAESWLMDAWLRKKVWPPGFQLQNVNLYAHAAFRLRD